jgi:hypothetical protein
MALSELQYQHRGAHGSHTPPLPPVVAPWRVSGGKPKMHDAAGAQPAQPAAAKGASASALASVLSSPAPGHLESAPVEPTAAESSTSVAACVLLYSKLMMPTYCDAV